MQKTKIEWVKNPDGTQGFTSNPISGLCPVACWYCYGKPLYRRKLNKYFDEQLMFWPHRLAKIQKRKKPAGIFMCSTFELFYKGSRENTALDFARDNIFKTIEVCPQHRFYILTKFPQNIDRPMPDNVWLGTSIDKGINFERAKHLYRQKAKVKFISFEPLLTPMIFTEFSYVAGEFDWVIVGRLTQHGKAYRPFRFWIEDIVNICKKFRVPIFLKNNLKEIWGEDLIQEMPE